MKVNKEEYYRIFNDLKKLNPDKTNIQIHNAIERIGFELELNSKEELVEMFLDDLDRTNKEIIESG